MTRKDKILAAKQHIAAKIGDILEKNFDSPSAALETPGTFTALIEAYRACEIAQEGAAAETANAKSATYRKGLQNL